jgi:hypothetical protein
MSRSCGSVSSGRPHCGFRPAEERTGAAPAKKVLGDLDEVLDGILRGWADTLLTNLEDPTVLGNIDLVSDMAGKSELKAFPTSRRLPDPISPSFVRALQEVLSGLEKVVIRAEGLQNALSDGGVPCTIPDLRERFDRYVSTLTRGKDSSKVRIVID